MLKARILAFSLTLIIIISSLFGCSEVSSPKETQKRPAVTERPTEPSSPNDEEPLENKVTVGTLLSLSGNFRFPAGDGAAEPSADGEIYSLTNGYSTIATTRGGSYVWDSTVVKSHSEEEIDGNLVITIELCEDLLFSDGTPVKASNYLAYLLAFASPVASSAVSASTVGSGIVGYEEFAAYNGANDGKTAIFTGADGVEKRVVASKNFSGVRLLGDYTFSLTLKPDLLPSCYAYVNACLSPYVTEHILGADVSIKDSSKGAYLDGPWYDRKSGVYVKAAHISAAQRDISTYAFSGPYVISVWDSERSECTLTINENYKGNHEGVKPSIDTVVYTKLASETQLNALTLGVVDVISGLKGGIKVPAALDAVRRSGGSLAASYYPEAYCRKLSLSSDLGPTAFLSVRRALAHALDSEQLSSDLAGGYGAALYAPYAPELDSWKQIADEAELFEYLYSPEIAKKSLVEGGWIYNADGSAYDEKKGGVRYKKLTAEEAEAHLSYSVTLGETEYKTELVGEDYYLPCAISWLGVRNDSFTSLVSAQLIESGLTDSLGIAISLTFEAQGAHGMLSSEESFESVIYFPSVPVADPYDDLFPYGEGGLSLDEALERSGGRLGLDYLASAMILDSSSPKEFNEWWREYIERMNALLPSVAICVSYRFDVYNTKIKGLETSPFQNIAEALVYCSVK